MHNLETPDILDLDTLKTNHEDIISMRGIKKSFNGQEVLRGVDLTVHRGETLVILGRSGGGKSVLVSMLVGLLTPDEGTILIEDQDVTQFQSEKEWNQIRLKIGFLFQGAALYDSMTVGENVAFPLRQHTKLSEEEIEKLVAEKLKWVELEGIEDKMPSELSGGMQKRVSLARTMALNPKIMIYDEPTTGLDPVTSDTIAELIRNLQQEFQVTSIVVTHDIRTTFYVADRIAMLHEGKILTVGTVDEIQNSPYQEVQQFIHGTRRGKKKG
jgi:phospholipid/cholesterol/gamma-HCH transport system ATP-binding protein